MKLFQKVEETAHKPIIIIREESPRKMKTNEAKDVLVVNPAEFRQKISLLHQRRNDCCRLAQEARRKKSYSVASYFSHLVSIIRIHKIIIILVEFLKFKLNEFFGFYFFLTILGLLIILS